MPEWKGDFQEDLDVTPVGFLYITENNYLEFV